MLKVALSFLVLLLSQNFVLSQRALIPVDSAALYFNQAKAMCRADEAKFWGKSLWGPMLIVNRETRRLIASHRDGDGLFTEREGVFLGEFPENLPMSEEPVKFGGKTWAVLIVPISTIKKERDQSVITSLFKRYQEQMGFNVGAYRNNHLENMDARIYIKLEWLALENALKRSAGEEHLRSITDALIFRNLRRSLYGQNIADERRFEVISGLGEYTSLKLTHSPEEIKRKLFYSRAYHWKMKSFTNSFGYHSGLIYAVLLDKKNGEDWKKNFKKTDDLGLLLQKSYAIKLPQDLKSEADKIKNNYMYDKIFSEESERERRWQKSQAACKATYTKNTIVEVDLFNFNVGCDPKMQQSIDSLGTLYPTAKIVDSWGVLDVNDGGLIITPDQKKVLLPVKNISNNGDKVTGNGWILKMEKGWELLKEGENYRIKQKESAETSG